MLLTASLQSFLFIFTRVIAIFMFLPVFGSNSIPLQIRILLMAFISLALTPFITLTVLAPYDLMGFTFYLILEFLVGVTIGFVGFLVTNAIYLAGLMIDMASGFAMVNVIGVQDESEVPITANFFYIIAMFIFLMLDFHHEIIKAIIRSYELIPVGGFQYNFFVLNHMFVILKETFAIGFQIAAPVLLTIMVMDLVLGILSKAMPGMNIFMVGMPFKILVALLTVYLLMPHLNEILAKLFYKMLDYMDRLLWLIRV